MNQTMTIGGRSRGTRIRKPAALSVIATAIFASCTTSPGTDHSAYVRCESTEADAAAERSCLQIPEPREYLEQAQRQIFEAWVLPDGISADQEVIVQFRLGHDGAIQCLSLTQELDEELARSTISAFERGAPFGPLPSKAACLAELPITATFSNPVAQ